MRRSRTSRGAACLAAVVLLAAGCRPNGAQPAGPRPFSAPVSPLATAGRWPRTFVDDLGFTVKLPGPPRRVVSLSPNMAEIVCFVGGSRQLVGVSDFCDYPPEAAAKTKIGGIVNPSFEKVVALHPDLVLAAQGNDLSFLRRLRDQGIPVFAAKPQSLDDVLSLTETVAELLGRETHAAAKIARLRQRVAQLTGQAHSFRRRPRALVVIEVDPLFVAGPGSFVDDLLRRAAMENAVTEGREWTRWSSERLIAADPDLVVLVRVHGAASATAATLRRKSPWRELKAVRRGAVFEVNEDVLTIPGPRLVDGLEALIAVHRQWENPSSAGRGDGHGQGA